MTSDVKAMSCACVVIRLELIMICFVIFFLNFKTFSISNFCNAGIRYLEHPLTRTLAISNFWKVPSRFEITSVVCIYGKKQSYLIFTPFTPI